jgi:spore germination protein
MLIHVVKAGDSLWSIANSYQVPLDSIISANGLADPDVLVVGEALVIPTAGVSYVVQPGDSLWKIAQKYGVTVANLATANNITNPQNLTIGSTLTIPNGYRPAIGVNGYIDIFGQAAVPIVNRHAELLTYLAPFAYLIREDAGLDPIDDEPIIQAMKAYGTVPMIAVTNFTSTSRGENLASQVLNDPMLVETLLDNILSVMNRKGYQGLNVDFENVLPEDREAYNNFLMRAADRLHAEGYFLSTALAPKTGPTQAGLLYEAHDYPAHGRIADFVVLMTYEWGYRKGPPQPISPINKIRQVLDYAVSVIPPEKIYLGFQIYARDWVLPHQAGQEAETFSPQEAISRAAKYGAEIMYDSEAASPFFRYTDENGVEHEVWFEDARSAQAKFDAVKDYGLAGISYWPITPAFPQNWSLLDATFIVKKREQ